SLPQLRDLQPVGLGAVLDRFLAPDERLGDRPHRHALARQRMQLLDFVLPPRLPVPLEPFAHSSSPACAGEGDHHRWWRGPPPFRRAIAQRKGFGSPPSPCYS